MNKEINVCPDRKDCHRIEKGLKEKIISGVGARTIRCNYCTGLMDYKLCSDYLNNINRKN